MSVSTGRIWRRGKCSQEDSLVLGIRERSPSGRWLGWGECSGKESLEEGPGLSGEGAQRGSYCLVDGTALRNVVSIKIVHENTFIFQFTPIGQSTVNVLKKQTSKMFSPSLSFLFSVQFPFVIFLSLITS